MVILGIDYGEKRVGLAIAEGPLSEPLGILNADQNLFQNLSVILDKHRVQEIVVGISEGKMADKSRAFISLLSDKFGLTVHEVDETLSSYEVVRRNKTGKKIYIDDKAAAIILQRWIDSLSDAQTALDPEEIIK